MSDIQIRTKFKRIVKVGLEKVVGSDLAMSLKKEDNAFADIGLSR